MDTKFMLCAFADEAAADFGEQLRTLKEHEIPLLELRGVYEKNIAMLEKSEILDVKKQLEEQEISVWSIGSPIGKIKLSDPFQPHLDCFRRLLDTAVVLGASRFRLFSFYEADASDGARDEVFTRLDAMITAAKGSGIVLCHENEKGIYGQTADACSILHQQFPALRAVFDPANFVQVGEDTLSAWEKLAPYVEYMHIKDAKANGQVVPAGKGVGNLPKLLARYAAIGGRVLSLEPHLANFAGLQALEQGGNAALADAFPTKRAAFAAGVAALKELLSNRKEFL